MRTEKNLGSTWRVRQNYESWRGTGPSFFPSSLPLFLSFPFIDNLLCAPNFPGAWNKIEKIVSPGDSRRGSQTIKKVKYMVLNGEEQGMTMQRGELETDTRERREGKIGEKNTKPRESRLDRGQELR